MMNGDIRRAVIGLVAACVLGLIGWAASYVSTLGTRIQDAEKRQVAHEAHEEDDDRRLEDIEGDVKELLKLVRRW